MLGNRADTINPDPASFRTSRRILSEIILGREKGRARLRNRADKADAWGEAGLRDAYERVAASGSVDLTYYLPQEMFQTRK